MGFSIVVTSTVFMYIIRFRPLLDLYAVPLSPFWLTYISMLHCDESLFFLFDDYVVIIPI